MGALTYLGAGLRKLRGDRTQAEVAQAAGVRPATVSDWETGATFPEALDKILCGLSADLYDLAAAVDEAGGRPPRPRPQRVPQTATLGYGREQLPASVTEEQLREWAILWEEEHEIRERRYTLEERLASTTA